ncbi:tetratricopeptide repeat protein 36 [Octopus sinensis]|uniref:Tetratricopeptide repeat protein 36 n=1 Tax=Octopus sinensis TaxID=2607531 RepID=A0A6P7T412_9MOLL|nr:tetratricopeptide repeat protein 36 [Octopus sinensis]
MHEEKSDRVAISDYDKAVLNRVFNPENPHNTTEDIEIINSNEEPKILAAFEQEAKSWEVRGVQEAEDGNLDSSIHMFTQAIQLAPQLSSGYNNRAQALRLKGDIQGALEDLDKAIELNTGNSAVCKAVVQRAILRRYKGDDKGALEDFKSAASRGSAFAQQMLIALNPYAALCNQMLCEVINKLKAGNIEESI